MSDRARNLENFPTIQRMRYAEGQDKMTYFAVPDLLLYLMAVESHCGEDSDTGKALSNMIAEIMHYDAIPGTDD